MRISAYISALHRRPSLPVQLGPASSNINSSSNRSNNIARLVLLVLPVLSLFQYVSEGVTSLLHVRYLPTILYSPWPTLLPLNQVGNRQMDVDSVFCTTSIIPRVRQVAPLLVLVRTYLPLLHRLRPLLLVSHRPLPLSRFRGPRRLPVAAPRHLHDTLENSHRISSNSNGNPSRRSRVIWAAHLVPSSPRPRCSRRAAAEASPSLPE
ncbi:hypothetical protein GGR56DRAFT_661267 [Xylariaceae sp. FL0804]|nr:hypothetical protein GGR56DRAFT_661267 [Xylariaceae sp. FL0804]